MHPPAVAGSLLWLATCRDAFVFEDCVEDPLHAELTIEKVRPSMERSAHWTVPVLV
jgi:hypothetical protein